MTSPVSIAVMGAGQIGKRHIEHILAASGATLHGVIDPSPAGRDVAAKAGAPWFPDFASMIAAAKPDGVADNIAAGQKLVEAGEKAGVAILTGHHRRHNPMIQRARATIEAGRLGRVVTVHTFFWLMKPDDYFDVPWRREIGAGPVLTNLIHDIDLMRYLCGEIEEVQAFQSNAVRQNAVDETTVVILRFANGALGTMNISDTVVAPWSWEQTTGEDKSFPQTDQSCYRHARFAFGAPARTLDQ
jgi:predicted dehydrogenase